MDFADLVVRYPRSDQSQGMDHLEHFYADLGAESENFSNRMVRDHSWFPPSPPSTCLWHGHRRLRLLFLEDINGKFVEVSAGKLNHRFLNWFKFRCFFQIQVLCERCFVSFLERTRASSLPRDGLWSKCWH